MSLVIPPDAKSWIAVDPDSHFPIQNLPFGLAAREDDNETVVVRIGDFAVDLCQLSACGLLPEEDFPVLHSLIDLDREDISHLRRLVYELLKEDNPTLRDDKELCSEALIPIDQVDMLVPVEIPAFVDFYSGIHHASNVGRMFRPDMPPLLPNYRHLPVAYNGRASSVIPSEVPVRRPKGQTKGADDPVPVFGPTKELDFELELGFFLSEGNDLGEPIPIGSAEDHILGVVLLNDWSARDVQRWEYQPLGPFLAKSFATSISPWIVSLDALEPFRVEGAPQEPDVLPHLQPSKPSHYDIHLEVAIQTEKMTQPQVLSRSNAKYLYWSFVQQLAHQTSNGTNTEPGDLYGTGTISGPAEGTYGSLLELSWRGQRPIKMTETGEERTFLEDGDTVIITGYCQGDGYRVGFGELRTTVMG
ncbi:fumarylacetoacetase [Fimbriimonas ginsengisoli]|uniref:fumarylacetoacetase n=1 Tax=Fimbriimonas ginsengisoli Gsoil 348 TaxID=661478 RepID=A0A068NU13_FIMGI|nr:fumarylacetoacetase [Fimbriimonas ginsengisoli]AIE85059.1 fumarylacetoacetase [Fimbriimonas ginsengisoli Gsoil 348]